MEKARTAEFKKAVKNVVSPFGTGNTSEQIHEKVMDWLLSGAEYNPKKKFHDISWE